MGFKTHVEGDREATRSDHRQNDERRQRHDSPEPCDQSSPECRLASRGQTRTRTRWSGRWRQRREWRFTTRRNSSMPQRFRRRLNLIRRARRHRRSSGCHGGGLDSNLRRIALRTERGAIFYLGATFRTGMLHKMKLSAQNVWRNYRGESADICLLVKELPTRSCCGDCGA